MPNRLKKGSKPLWVRLLGGACLLLAATYLQAHPGVERALDYLSRQLQDRADPQLYLQRAELYILHQDYPLAAADIAAAERLGAQQQAACVQGELAAATGVTEFAIEQFSQCLQAYPGALRALQARARAYHASGQAALALQDYQQLLAQAEAPAPGQYLAAAGLAEQTGMPALALAILDQGLARLGLITTLQRAAVSIAVNSHQLDSALERQQGLRQAMKNSPLWQLQMADLYVQAGDYPAALQLLDRLLASNPDNPLDPNADNRRDSSVDNPLDSKADNSVDSKADNKTGNNRDNKSADMDDHDHDHDHDHDQGQGQGQGQQLPQRPLPQKPGLRRLYERAATLRADLVGNSHLPAAGL